MAASKIEGCARTLNKLLKNHKEFHVNHCKVKCGNAGGKARKGKDKVHWGTIVFILAGTCIMDLFRTY